MNQKANEQMSKCADVQSCKWSQAEKKCLNRKKRIELNAFANFSICKSANFIYYVVSLI